jgi:N-dimethylarginine dimethylaminohydrolase
MGKKARLAEPNTMEDYFKSIQMPILGRIKAPGTLEGGDVVWIDEKTIAVGEGYRTNKEGIKQLKHLLSDQVENVISVPIPHWSGPEDCLHLMSNISPVDHNLYLVYSRLLPVPFRKYLLDRNIELIDVPDEEYESMGCNVLAVAPRKVIMINGNSITKKLLEKKDIDVYTYDGAEISIKGAGGPTCLTRPFVRSI